MAKAVVRSAPGGHGTSKWQLGGTLAGESKSRSVLRHDTVDLQVRLNWAKVYANNIGFRMGIG